MRLGHRREGFDRDQRSRPARAPTRAGRGRSIDLASTAVAVAGRCSFDSERITLADSTHPTSARSRFRARLVAPSSVVVLALAVRLGSPRPRGRTATRPATFSPCSPCSFRRTPAYRLEQQAQLVALLAAARRSGYQLRVALIASSTDLGSVTELWRQPQSYAQFLGQELSLVYRGPVLGGHAQRLRAVPSRPTARRRYRPPSSASALPPRPPEDSGPLRSPRSAASPRHPVTSSPRPARPRSRPRPRAPPASCRGWHSRSASRLSLWPGQPACASSHAAAELPRPDDRSRRRAPGVDGRRGRSIRTSLANTGKPGVDGGGRFPLAGAPRCRWIGRRAYCRSRHAEESLKTEMRFSRHAWWLYLALMAPIAVALPRGAAQRRTGVQRDRLQWRASRSSSGVRMHRPAARWAWYLLALGQACSSRATCSPTTTRRSSARRCPFPSIADPFYLAVLSGHRRRAAAPDQAPQPGARLGEPDRRGDRHDRPRAAVVGLPDRAVRARHGAPAGNEAGLDRLSARGHPDTRGRRADGRRRGPA